MELRSDESQLATYIYDKTTLKQRTVEETSDFMVSLGSEVPEDSTGLSFH